MDGGKEMDFGYREEKESAFSSILREWPILLIEVIVAIVLGFLLITFGFDENNSFRQFYGPCSKRWRPDYCQQDSI